MSKFLAVLILVFSISVHAEHWVIKNPRQTFRNLKNYSVLNLKNQYLIIEANERITPQQLVSVFQADAAFPDVEITMDKPTEPPPPPPESDKGWHTKFLKYSELNPKYTGQGVTVAVIDSGVDYNHYALVKKMWKNRKEIPGNNIDDDGNGLVDDYDGYNFNNNNIALKDTIGHGTHCAGLIAADVEPLTGAQGVAQNVKVMPLLIINENYAGQLSAAARAIKYATDNGAKVLSNSWRIYNDWQQFVSVEAMQMLNEALDYADEHDVIYVAAAGNEKKNLDETNLINPIIPLSLKKDHKNMIGVSSMALEDGEEVIFKSSNYGKKLISFSAPGKNIYSTLPNGKWGFNSGTSMATPIVAGAIARGISKGYNPKEAVSELSKSSNKSTYWHQYISNGRIDLKKYLE